MALVLAALTTLAAAAFINFYIDAGGVFQTTEERKTFAQSYVDKLLAIGEMPYQGRERSIKLALAAKGGSDCIVWGSSKEMELSPTTAPRVFGQCKSFANLAVSGGGFEDLIAAIGSLGAFEGSIAIGVGPWLFRWRAEIGRAHV